MKYHFKCPYCATKAVLGDDEYALVIGYGLQVNNSQYYQCYALREIKCQLVSCARITLRVDAFETKNDKYDRRYHRDHNENIRHSVQIYPNVSIKELPKYLPESIREDFKEAYSIKNLSPKASATLARRCLQGMIRDFWGINNKNTLYSEIMAIQEKIEPGVFEMLHSIKSIGNRGAHPDINEVTNINEIVNIEPHEAEVLLSIIETLADDWYGNRFRREQNTLKVKQIAEKFNQTK